MTDQHQDHLDPLADDPEVAALRALVDDAGLLPDLPASHQPTAASAERVLARVLATADEPATASARVSARVGGREVALAARRRRTRTTQTLFGLAATVLVGAVIVVPMVAQGGDDGAAGAADSAAVAPEAAGHGISPQTEGLLPTTRGAEPHGLVADALVSGVLIGTVVDDDGCLAVREDATGTIYVPIDTPGVPVREHLVVGDLVTIQRVTDPHVFDNVDVPEGCDPMAFFWPAQSFGTGG